MIQILFNNSRIFLYLILWIESQNIQHTYIWGQGCFELSGNNYVKNLILEVLQIYEQNNLAPF